MNLGALVPPGESTFFYSNGINVELPPNVKNAFASLYHLTSSVACIVIHFNFEENFKSSYEELLRRAYETKHKPHKGGVTSIITPSLQKRDEVLAVRLKMRADIYRWFSKNIPGVFSRNHSLKNFPTCELVFTENFETYPEQCDEERLWLSALNYDHTFDVWENNNLQGAKFTWPVIGDKDTEFHSALTVSRANLRKLDMNMYGGHDESNYMGYLSNETSEFLSRWSCLALMSHYEEKLGNIRDSQRHDSIKTDAVKTLEIVKSLTSDSVDIACLSPEIIDFCKNDITLQDQTYILRDDKNRNHSIIYLFDIVKRELEAKSNNMLQTDRKLKELMAQEANLISEQKNIKLQKSMKCLTWVSIIFGAITIIMGYISLPDEIKEFLYSEIKNLLITIGVKFDSKDP